MGSNPTLSANPLSLWINALLGASFNYSLFRLRPSFFQHLVPIVSLRIFSVLSIIDLSIRFQCVAVNRLPLEEAFAELDDELIATQDLMDDDGKIIAINRVALRITDAARIVPRGTKTGQG